MKLAIPVLVVLCAFTVPALPPYKDVTHGYTISYPEGWQEADMGGIHVFLSPKEDTADAFQENLNVIVQDLSKQPMKFDAYVKLNKDQYAQILGKDGLKVDRPATLGGQPAHEFEYAMPQGKYNPQPFDLQVRQFVLMKGKKAYILTYTAQPASFNKFLPQADAAFATFKAR